MFWRRPSRTVMIVAEEQTESALNTAFLHQPSIRLLKALPNARGLRMACRKRPSLIIEEIQADDRDGLAFCRRLRSDPRTSVIPLILVVDPELHDQARRTEADALLDKPLVRQEYFEAVRRFLPLPKRKNDRLPVNLRFIYWMDGRPGQAFSRDISSKGAFIHSDSSVPVGTQMQLEFALPGVSEPFRCRAIVRRNAVPVAGSSGRSGFAIEFLDLGEHSRERLEGFIASHQSRRAR